MPKTKKAEKKSLQKLIERNKLFNELFDDKIIEINELIKKEEEKEKKLPPAATVIDYLNWLTKDKKRWEELSPADQKGFQPFILNRFLSMHLNFCEAVNIWQSFLLGIDKKFVWKMYYEKLPKDKIYFSYIKATALEGVTDREIDIFKEYFSVSREHAIDYFLTLKGTESGREKIKTIINNFVYDKKI